MVPRGPTPPCMPSQGPPRRRRGRSSAPVGPKAQAQVDGVQEQAEAREQHARLVVRNLAQLGVASPGHRCTEGKGATHSPWLKQMPLGGHALKMRQGSSWLVRCCCKADQMRASFKRPAAPCAYSNSQVPRQKGRRKLSASPHARGGARCSIARGRFTTARADSDRHCAHVKGHQCSAPDQGIYEGTAASAPTRNQPHLSSRRTHHGAQQGSHPFKVHS